MASPRTREAAVVCLLLACAGAGIAVSVARSHHTDRPSPGPTASAPAPASTPPDPLYSLSVTGDSQWSNEGSTGSYTMHVVSSAAVAVTVLAPQQGAVPPGLQLVDASDRVVIPPGQSAPMTLRFRITDCHLIPRAPWPLRVRAYTPESARTPRLVELNPVGYAGRTWQESVAGDYCGFGP